MTQKTMMRTAAVLACCARAMQLESVGRRQVLGGAGAGLGLLPSVSAAAGGGAGGGGLGGVVSDGGALTTLRRRVGQRVTSARPSYGLDSGDVYYPDFFEGTWRTTSRAVAVEAPLGAQLFGGNASLSAARAELGAAPVVYESRFVRDARGRLISDRPFNIASLAAATMAGGPDAIRDLPRSDQFNPDQVVFRLAPADAPGGAVYRAELRALARRYEPSSGVLRDEKGRAVFDFGELTRQQISLPGDVAAPPSVKDIETINCFTLLRDGKLEATQRTTTWLVATEGYAALRAQAADGRAVDVRTYAVDYDRVA